MSIYIVSSGDITCDECQKVLGKMEYDKKDGDFLEDHVKITCQTCLTEADSGELKS